MAGSLFALPKQIPLDNGVVLPGALLTFSATGTSTLQDTYSDLALTTPHANPVVADSEGVFAPIYLDPSLPNYRVRLTDSASALIYQVDDVPSTGVGTDLTLTGTAPFLDLVETGVTADNTTWRAQANGEQLLLRVGNDALTLFTNILTVDRTENTVDTVNLLPTTLQHNGASLATVTSGSFTPVHTGFSTPPTGDISWNKSGNIVSLHIDFSTGTSNATSWTITNWPAALQVDTTISVPFFGYVDNTVSSSGTGIIALTNASAVATLTPGVLGASWTASGTKGLSPSSGAVPNVMYCVDNV